jgi:hypothetical protein
VSAVIIERASLADQITLFSIADVVIASQCAAHAGTKLYPNVHWGEGSFGAQILQ